MKSITFYWSRGAEIRRSIVLEILTRNEEEKPCFTNQLAKHLGLTPSGLKKHISLLTEEGYIEHINPKGKPIYLRLTALGKKVVEEFSKKK